MAMRELRVGEVLIRQHRGPDDTSLHSEKHIRAFTFCREVSHYNGNSTPFEMEDNMELVMI
uniref:Uncharacterized protein n=1 Tax=Strigamia maritima TaxID=126957 RepID=T1IRD6_STRMM